MEVLPKYTIEFWLEFDVRNVILVVAADMDVTLYLLKWVTGGMV